MKYFLIQIYRFIFCHKIFYSLNQHLYNLSLRGIGVLNSEGPGVSGESYLFSYLQKNYPLKIIVDVGANIGSYSHEVRSYFPNAKIYAFEPHPKTFIRLKKIAKKDQIKAFNLALGSHVGKLKLWDFAQDAELKYAQPSSPLASVHRKVIEELHKQKSDFYEVSLDTLDNIAAIQKIDQIDFLKIDTEGSEYDVLLGAKNLLKQNKIDIVQFEFNEMNIYSRRFLKDFMELLPKHDFYRLMPKGLLPLGSYRPLTHEIFVFQNIVAIPKKSSPAFL